MHTYMYIYDCILFHYYDKQLKLKHSSKKKETSGNGHFLSKCVNINISVFRSVYHCIWRMYIGRREWKEA